MLKLGFVPMEIFACLPMAYRNCFCISPFIKLKSAVTITVMVTADLEKDAIFVMKNKWNNARKRTCTSSIRFWIHMPSSSCKQSSTKTILTGPGMILQNVPQIDGNLFESKLDFRSINNLFSSTLHRSPETFELWTTTPNERTHNVWNNTMSLLIVKEIHWTIFQFKSEVNNSIYL